MPMKKTTREKLKREIEGMMYHCTNMTEFMSNTVQDPYFETEEGKEMRKYMTGILFNHVMALTKFMISNEDDVKHDEPKFNFEELLKDSFE